MDVGLPASCVLSDACKSGLTEQFGSPQLGRDAAGCCAASLQELDTMLPLLWLLLLVPATSADVATLLAAPPHPNPLPCLPGRVNRFNSFEGWVGSESVGADILVSGRIDMNRAMEGDIVAGGWVQLALPVPLPPVSYHRVWAALYRAWSAGWLAWWLAWAACCGAVFQSADPAGGCKGRPGV